jgi:transposase
MADLSEFALDSCPLGHLPIIAEYVHRLGIYDTLSEILPMDRRMKVSDAECVTLMILNILQGRCGLYHMGPWAQGTDSEVLIGEGIDPLRLSDTRIAHALDRIFEYGPDNVLSDVVVHYLRQDAAPSEYCVHQDTTTLKLYGEYDRSYKLHEPVPRRGYSKDHRPDLKQLVFGLSLHGAVGIPMCVSTLDGNTSDHVANRLHIDRLAGLLPPEDDVTLVADCKLADPETLGMLIDAAFHFITLLPRSYKLHANVVDSALDLQGPLPELVREKGRRKGDPDHVYKGTSFRSPFEILDPETNEPRKTDLRFLAVESDQLAEKFEVALPDLLAKDRKHIEKIMDKLGRSTFACESDAEKAFWDTLKEPKLHRVDVQIVPVEVRERRERRGRPAKGEQPPVIHTRFRLVTGSIEVDESAVTHARDHARFFVLVTDHMGDTRWPDTRVLEEYRHQHLIEGHTGFRWLKGPAAAAPMFLNTPWRIAALGMVFVLALMVRNYIEFMLRDRLAALPEEITLPNMDDRPTRKPSAENVFWLFRRVGVVMVRHGGVLLERRLSGLDDNCKLALRLVEVPVSVFTTPRKRSEASERS